MLSTNAAVLRITMTLHLTPYQSYILEQNVHKYNLEKLAKRGNMLYAPYKCDCPQTFMDNVKHFFLGPRADLIGPENVISVDKRGVRL